jgi:pimeloyl-ACP methyl ester carboxylesterase
MGLKDLSHDLQAALDYILLDNTSAPEPVLVAHSSGGGLAQYALANSNPDDEPLVSGLVLLARSLHLVCAVSSSPGCASTRGISPVSSGTWVIYVLRFPHHRSCEELSLVHTRPRRDVQEFFSLYMNHEETVSWMRDMMFRYARAEECQGKDSRRAGTLHGRRPRCFDHPRYSKGHCQ